MPRRRLRIPRMGERRGAGRARSRGRLGVRGTPMVHAVIINVSVNERVTRVQHPRPHASRLVRLSLSAACACLLGAAADDEIETVPDRAPAELLPAAMVSGTDFQVVAPV